MTKLVVTVQNYTDDVISAKEVDVVSKIPGRIGGTFMTSQISWISNMRLIISMCDMLISCKALCYRSSSLFLQVCPPHIQDHRLLKFSSFHGNAAANILNISAWICIYFMTPHFKPIF